MLASTVVVEGVVDHLLDETAGLFDSELFGVVITIQSVAAELRLVVTVFENRTSLTDDEVHVELLLSLFSESVLDHVCVLISDG